MTKVCSVCKTLKSNYGIKDKRRGTYRAECNDCRAAYARRRAAARPKSQRFLRVQRNQEYLTLGLRECPKCGILQDLTEYDKGQSSCKLCFKIYYNKNKEAICEKNKHSYYRNKYGVTREQLGHSCEICKKATDLVIDHCHASGNTRGLLCRQCNAGIGLLGDSSKRVYLAWEYLCAFQSTKETK